MMPPVNAIPVDTKGMSDEDIRELADAYLDLLTKMTAALHECDTNVGFFRWSGQGFLIDGHPPAELVERLKATGGQPGN